VIDHDNSCSVVYDGVCNCKGGKIKTHVHTLVRTAEWLMCTADNCDYIVPLTERPPNTIFPLGKIEDKRK
jgi:hypothetical protein